MVKILAISGSLRDRSSNTKLLILIAQFSPDIIDLLPSETIANLPQFNPDLDVDPAIESVQFWREQLRHADGVIFCTPEYAQGVPGSLKNALDWIVSSGEFMNKPTLIISASPGIDGGRYANESLGRTLGMMMTEVCGTLCIPGSSAMLSDRGELIDLDIEGELRSLVSDFIQSINR
jgi:chromate reductase, NAD(P)H dehydrogenase (quinone)